METVVLAVYAAGIFAVSGRGVYRKRRPEIMAHRSIYYPLNGGFICLVEQSIE